MDSGNTTSLQDLLRRLRTAGDEHYDLRCLISHGIELPCVDVEIELGELFALSIFRPLVKSKDLWRIGFYRENSKNPHRGLHRVRGNEFAERINELNDSAKPIPSRYRLHFWS